MKKVVVDFLMKNISKNYNYDDTKLLEIRYGIETLYLTITKAIIVTIIAIIIGTIKELLWFTLFYGILRLVGFGLHAKKSWHCWVFTLLLFTLIPYLISVLTIQKNILLIVFICSTILFIIYAPADTEKRPLIHKNKRIIYKILTVTISIIYIISSYFTPRILTNSLMFACVMQSLMINPISYKLLGLKFNNYKSYKKGGKL